MDPPAWRGRDGTPARQSRPKADPCAAPEHPMTAVLGWAVGVLDVVQFLPQLRRALALRHHHEAVRALMPHFAEARRGELVSLRRGNGEIGTRRVWTLVGWRGTWPVSR